MSRKDSGETLSIMDKQQSIDQSILQPKKSKVVILTDKEKAAEAKKIQDFYQSKVQPVENWDIKYLPENMVDGTDVELHVEKNRAIKCLLDDPEDDDANNKKKKQMSALDRLRKSANFLENKAQDADGDTEGGMEEFGGYYIDGGKLNAITKPRADKLPKTQVDLVKIAVTDGEIQEEETQSVF